MNDERRILSWAELVGLSPRNSAVEALSSEAGTTEGYKSVAARESGDSLRYRDRKLVTLTSHGYIASQKRQRPYDPCQLCHRSLR